MWACVSGEYHLDLIVKYGAVPIIVPRVSGIHKLIHSFEPIHGVLLCEGEDIDPSLYDSDFNSGDLSHEDLEEIRRAHASDTAIDKEKDSIELSLAKLCLDRHIPYLGICRGSQVHIHTCLYLHVDLVIVRVGSRSVSVNSESIVDKPINKQGKIKKMNLMRIQVNTKLYT